VFKNEKKFFGDKVGINTLKWAHKSKNKDQEGVHKCLVKGVWFRMDF
jgi:hypothetical protein